MSDKPESGQRLAEISLPQLGGGELRLGTPVDQMHSPGLYVSEPRSEEETDRPFAEPGVFVINADGLLQVVDISNALQVA